MLTIVVSERADGWSVETETGSGKYDQAHDAYRAGLAEVDRLYGEGVPAQLVMVTGLSGGERSFEAFVRLEA